MCVHGGEGRNTRLGNVIRDKAHDYPQHPASAVEALLADIAHFAHTNGVDLKDAQEWATEVFTDDKATGDVSKGKFQPRKG